MPFIVVMIIGKTIIVMTKNTEWGSVAYLQHSKYGSMASVRINNSDNLTGYAAVNEPTCGYTGDNRDCNKYGIEASVTQPWNTDIGYLASTTGNISGVYDMSGGAWEYVMGVMLDQDGNLVSGRNFLHNSGFNGKFSCPTCDGQTGVSLTTGTNFPTDSRYYDQYAYVQNDETYNRRILGDATGEIGPFADAKYNNLIRQIGSWYADEAWFISLNYPWFNRGSSYLHGSGTGIFMFDPHHGGASGYANTSGSFRIVLSI